MPSSSVRHRSVSECSAMQKKALLTPSASGLGKPFHPLHLPPPTPMLLRRTEDGEIEKELQEIRQRRRAQKWPCSHCTFLLGFCHLAAGLALLTFDVVTNHITRTPFGITAALSFIVLAIFSFIASRRVDKTAQVLLLVFAVTAICLCLVLFLQSAVFINRTCHGTATTRCFERDAIVHVALLCLTMFEAVFCLAAVLVVFRSLREAYLVPFPSQPYRTLIAGDYASLRREPARVCAPKHSDLISALLH